MVNQKEPKRRKEWYKTRVQKLATKVWRAKPSVLSVLSTLRIEYIKPVRVSCQLDVISLIYLFAGFLSSKRAGQRQAAKDRGPTPWKTMWKLTNYTNYTERMTTNDSHPPTCSVPPSLSYHCIKAITAMPKKYRRIKPRKNSGKLHFYFFGGRYIEIYWVITYVRILHPSIEDLWSSVMWSVWRYLMFELLTVAKQGAIRPKSWRISEQQLLHLPGRGRLRIHCFRKSSRLSKCMRIIRFAAQGLLHNGHWMAMRHKKHLPMFESLLTVGENIVKVEHVSLFLRIAARRKRRLCSAVASLLGNSVHSFRYVGGKASGCGVRRVCWKGTCVQHW